MPVIQSKTAELLEDAPKKKSFGINSGKKIYEGYNEERKVKNRKEKVKARLGYTAFSKEFENTNSNFPTKHLDRIICGNALKHIKELPDNSTDLVVTSPFHNLKQNKVAQKGVDNWQENFSYLCEVLNECIRVLKYGGRIMINVDPSYSQQIPAHHLVSKFLFDKGMIWKAEIIWDKNSEPDSEDRTISVNPQLEYSWSFLEVFCKGNLKKEGASKDIDIKDKEFISWVNASWDISSEQDGDKQGLPAQLVERILKLFSYRGDVILDPFNGIGTSTHIAAKMSRHYLGIETSRAKCKIAEERLSVKKSA